MQDAGAMLDERNYTVGITLVARQKLWQDALYIFRSISTAGLSPNAFNYTATISACEKAGHWQMALHLFQEMLKELLADVVGFSAAISSCEKGFQWQTALDLFQSMQRVKVHPNVYSYSAAISASERGGQWALALALLVTMFTVRILPNKFSYSAAISACGKNGQWQRALRLFEEMVTTHVSPNVVSVNATISAFEKVGKWQLALCFLKGFRSITPDLISYNATMSSCEKGGKWQMALHVFLDMYKKKISPDVTSYGAVVSACEKDAEWQLALHLLRRWQRKTAKNLKLSGGQLLVSAAKEGAFPKQKVAPLNVEEFSAKMFLEAFSEKGRRMNTLSKMIEEAEVQIKRREQQSIELQAHISQNKLEIAHLQLDLDWHRSALEGAEERRKELQTSQRKLLGTLHGKIYGISDQASSTMCPSSPAGASFPRPPDRPPGESW
ncbi:unnamed protein product [Cladocopium goreaui]|uniref:Pentatricopeptide repeat-containing protein GUN1, chloroplastic (Pentatricopeptide repeat-containing protein At2g31400) (Protein GENOMES UNCOUPLED 1) n=1 Tax=Cladocopium goreaui TaxID=2562237 RepID=A0A9P1CAG5_9DINO|nr:unnamed protein product [Cladocopium goreaui]